MRLGSIFHSLGAPPDQGEGGARILDLRREARHHLLRIGGRRGPRPGDAREHLLHRSFEAGHVRRRLVQAVLENEGRHAALGERARHIPAFVLHRQRPEAAARRDDDGGTARLGGVGQKRRERRHRDVAGELAAVLGVPRLLRLRVRERAGANLDRVRLIGRRDRRHRVVRLREDGRRARAGRDQNRGRKQMSPGGNEHRMPHHAAELPSEDSLVRSGSPASFSHLRVLRGTANDLRVAGGGRGHLGRRPRERTTEERHHDTGRRLLGGRRPASAAHHLGQQPAARRRARPSGPTLRVAPLLAGWPLARLSCGATITA